MKTLSVYELVHYLKGELENNLLLQNILVSGEISNFNHHFSGHLYFSLKDDKARISCVMFKTYASRILFKPKDGDKVILRGNISVYENSGQMQLYVLDMKPDGLGDLYLRYELLKKELADKGYFDIEHKITPKKYPMNIAVLVGDKSAALSDIKTCFKRRWPIANVDIYPVLVQGEGSSIDIINNLLKVDDMNYDAIILARGGGSIEDLWSFNDEALAKCIYNLKTFIITGVGHEQDFTIADFVADLRAPTPTAAVELITPNIIDVIDQLDNYHNRLNKAMQSVISDLNVILEHINSSIIFKNPYYLLKSSFQEYDNLSLRLLNYEKHIKDVDNSIDIKIEQMASSLKRILNKKENMLNLLNQDLKHLITKEIDDKNKQINIDIKAMKLALRNTYSNTSLIHKRLTTLLKAYGYEETLKRGFSVVMMDDKVIKDASDLKFDDEISIKLYKGDIKAKVKEIKND